MVDVGHDVLAGSDQTGRSDRRSRQQWLTLATMCWIRLVEVVDVGHDVLAGSDQTRIRSDW